MKGARGSPLNDQEALDARSRAYVVPNKIAWIPVLCILCFLHVRAYKRPPLSMIIWLVFNLDESRNEFILVFIINLLCHV